MRAPLLVASLLLARIAAAAPTVADVQVVRTGDRTAVVRVQSTEPQAFDVVSSTAKQLRVRLHAAQLGTLPPIPADEVGTVTVKADGRRGVVVTLVYANGWRGTAVQGGSPAVVELRLAHP